METLVALLTLFLTFFGTDANLSGVAKLPGQAPWEWTLFFEQEFDADNWYDATAEAPFFRSPPFVMDIYSFQYFYAIQLDFGAPE